MRAIVYRCPDSGLMIDHWFEPVEPSTSSETYEAVVCRACNRIHLVNMDSGQVLFAEARSSSVDGRRDIRGSIR